MSKLGKEFKTGYSHPSQSSLSNPILYPIILIISFNVIASTCLTIILSLNLTMLFGSVELKLCEL